MDEVKSRQPANNNC